MVKFEPFTKRIVCVYCSKTFDTINFKRKYCSDSCMLANLREIKKSNRVSKNKLTVYKVCSYCGCKYNKVGNSKRFCSTSCTQSYMYDVYHGNKPRVVSVNLSVLKPYERRFYDTLMHKTSDMTFRDVCASLNLSVVTGRVYLTRLRSAGINVTI